MAGYVKCVACPSSAMCDEEGQCLNTWVTAQDRRGACVRSSLPPGHHTATLTRIEESASGYSVTLQTADGHVVTVGMPAAKPAKAPPSAPRAPGGGTVTDQIFAACDAVLAEMWPEGSLTTPRETQLAEARKLAIPRLEAAGVNINSARKGSSMWIASRR